MIPSLTLSIRNGIPRSRQHGDLRIELRQSLADRSVRGPGSSLRAALPPNRFHRSLEEPLCILQGATLPMIAARAHAALAFVASHEFQAGLRRDGDHLVDTHPSHLR